MVIMCVFVVAYGIASQAILYPNSDLNVLLVNDILKHAWWSIFGEFNIDEISGQFVEFAEHKIYNISMLEKKLNLLQWIRTQ